ncbi:organic hydroperoxide reductase OsmC/OhrA [Chryseobacterium defluvii]|uniref:Organic hydroperoxide reductase OsmC/OhrA n=1 Tax=Chryseobacterium defluvii TaxID=160396 RepID=A0A840KDX8_9FLAO|nr:OsmC family protein [Chryseobacterium defluvii]MBB4807739.1 organic hydroperoxide reductase OsmC/OhrA [Chryseobacterium defluvii]
MSKEHHYKATIQWTGNKGTGTDSYRSYERSHMISVENKAVIEGSSDPAFRGDKTKYNPEEMLLASLSSCHMLWYLHFCSEEGIIVTAYTDHATGIMTETPNGSGCFKEVYLNPEVIVSEETMVEKARQLHHKANEYCFIANSVNFPVKHIPIVLVK